MQLVCKLFWLVIVLMFWLYFNVRLCMAYIVLVLFVVRSVYFVLASFNLVVAYLFGLLWLCFKLLWLVRFG